MNFTYIYCLNIYPYYVATNAAKISIINNQDIIMES